ncbi:MAG: anthranilate phosphoribosyltransferase [Armatimonadota bacterium]
MIREAIKKVVEGYDLTEQEATESMQEIMDGDATPAQIASFITALRMKGETVEEVAGFARTMREKSIKIPTSRDTLSLIDTCGTGGDRSNTFNISTTTAFVAAGAGLAVAKHGNRAMSSKCGSADVLEALGIQINLSPKNVGRCVDEIGIGFLFAPAYHPSMKYAVVPRKEIGIRTVFNILGPLTNPAGARKQLLGVCEPHMTELIAGALQRLGSDHAIVAHGLDGIDELSTFGTTKITELQNGQLTTYEITPEEIGLERSDPANLAQGEDPAESARILERILEGEVSQRRDIVLLNAGAAFKVAGMVESLTDGMIIAGECIDSGRSLNALNQLRKLSHDLSSEHEE